MLEYVGDALGNKAYVLRTLGRFEAEVQVPASNVAGWLGSRLFVMTNDTLPAGWVPVQCEGENVRRRRECIYSARPFWGLP